MTQVIVIEPNKTLHELISINLSAFLAVDIIERQNAADAINLLSILPSIELVILPSKIENEESAIVLIDYIKLNKLKTNLIILGGQRFFDEDFVQSIPKYADWESVILHSAKILGIDPEKLKPKIGPEYFPVALNYFYSLEHTLCDVFIRIRKSPSEFQYIKRIHKGDEMTAGLVEKYEKQGLQHFYITKDDYKNFTTYLSNQLVLKLEKELSDQKDINKYIKLMGESYDIATHEILKLGFQPESIQLTDSIVHSMVRNTNSTPVMANLLHKLINSKTGLLFQNAHMTSVVAQEILKKLKMSQMESIETIAYAAFFMDIMFADYEELLKINDREEAVLLLPEQRDLVLKHAAIAHELVLTQPALPIGVGQLILEHHGAYDGVGFNHRIDGFSDLSKIFIIAREFVLRLILFKERGGETRPITDELYKIYPAPDMILIIKALERSLKKTAN